MKVVHVSNYFPGLHEHTGGAEQAMQWSMQMHKQAGIENVLVTTRSTRPATVQHQAVPVMEDYLPRAREILEPVKWYALQFDPLSVSKLLWIVRRERADAVHFGNAQFVTLGALPLLRQAGVKTILSIYDYWLFCPLTTLVRQEQEVCHMGQGVGCLRCLPPVHRAAQRVLLSARPPLMRYLCGAIDRFVVLSESSRQIALRNGIPDERIRTIRLPREPSAAERPRDERPGDVLLVGWQQWRKGIHIILEAWPRVLAAVPDARLIIVGGGVKFGDTYAERLKALTRHPGVEQSVRFAGRVSDEELDRLLEEAAVLCIPEQWENMSPLILLRGLELQKGIVASRIGGIPEFARHEREAFLAEPGSAREFAAGIIRLLEDPALRRTLGQAGRARVAEVCDPARTLAGWEALYREFGLGPRGQPIQSSARSKSSR